MTKTQNVFLGIEGRYLWAKPSWGGQVWKEKETVKEVMEKFKEGELKSGKSRKIGKSKKQAIAIGLSEAREKGAKVPPVSKKAS